MGIIELEDDYLDEEYLDDITFSLDSAKEIVLGSSDWTVETIMSQISNGRINLNPEFQRRDAWNFSRKSSFIESLILNFPIPQIVLAEDKINKGRFIVIDGKQRLLTLMQFFGKKKFDKFKLEKLNILKQFNKKTIDDLKDDPNLQEYIDILLNTSIRTVVIKNWSDDALLYNIFYRLNANTAPLSPQELRTALYPGDFVRAADNFTSKNTYTKRIYNTTKPDFRMRDIELLVRFAAFNTRIEYYSGNMKQFLDDICKILNKVMLNDKNIFDELSGKFNLSCKTSYNIFKNNTFNKFSNGKFESKFNKAVFDVITYYFADEEITKPALANRKGILNAFIELCTEDSQFLSALERTTKSIDATQYRFTAWGEALKKLLDVELHIPGVGFKR